MAPAARTPGRRKGKTMTWRLRETAARLVRRRGALRGASLLVVAACALVLGAAAAAAETYTETTGPGPTHTWTDYHDAGGSEGPSIPDNSTVQITCRAEGFRVEDGNTWWYLIASSPWSDNYWASADAFYNDGQTTGSLKGTPFVDPKVRLCSEPAAAPSVSTGAASSVTQHTATLSASVNPNGGNVSYCAFQYGTSLSYGASAPCSGLPGSGTSPVGVAAGVTGLSANTTYHFRIVATNADGTSYGGDQTLTTPPNAPATTTESALSVSQVGATLTGTVNPEGGNVSGCEFEYGTSAALGSSAPCSSLPGSGTSPVAVSAPITGLTADTTYYFRVAATNAGGTGHGSEQTFATLVYPPTVQADPPTSLGQVSATLNATVDPNDGEVSTCQFEYGSSEAYGSSVPCSSLPGAGASPVSVSASIAGLSPSTVYHFRIVASNAGGTAEGADETFQTTSPVLPELGRCASLPRAVGRYKTAACTTKSPGEDSGSYEWEPWPAANDGFAFANGPAKLETAAKSTVQCAENTLAGEYTGSQSMRLTIKFTGCAAPGALGGRCQSEGAQAGEIETSALTGRLGVIKAGKKPTVGWDIEPAAGPYLAVFKCGEASVALNGSVIAPVTSVDKMASAFVLKFKAAKGIQKPTQFEAGVGDTLGFVTNSAEEPAGLTMTDSLSGEEPVEIKAIP